MTIRDSLYFKYAGINSYDKGLMSVSINSGLYTEDISGQRSINEDEDIAGNRYLKDIDNDPIEIPVSFYFDDGFDDNKVREVARWLLQRKYQPLIFSNFPDKIYYAIPIGTYRLIHNGLKEGYLELTFRCNTYHAFSPTYKSELYDLSNNNDTVVNFKNKGDLDVQPVLHIEKVGDGDLSFINLSNEGRTMKIGNLNDGEEIVIDCNKSEIETNSNENRYNDFNFQWLNLIYGINRIKVIGNCKFYYTVQFKIY